MANLLSDNILENIKKMLGIEATYTAFDTDVTIGINSALMTLNQIGVGPVEGFSIETGKETWGDFFDGVENLQAAKTFVYLTVKLAFDPPSTSFALDSINNQRNELISRLNMQVETPPDQE